LAKYLSIKNIEACKKAQTISQYEQAAAKTHDFFSDAIEARKIVLVPSVCEKYREFLIAEGVDTEVANACRTQVILNKLASTNKGRTISFHSQTGNSPSISAQIHYL
jgi:hypothetical protein